MNYKLLALDLDGTLTNSQKEISPRTKEALRKAQEKGVRIVLASGRPESGVLPLAKELELSRYHGFTAAFNGGKIVDATTGKIVFQAALPKEILPILHQFSKKHNAPLITYDHRILTEDEPNEYMELESRINHMEIFHVDNLVKFVDFPVTKCLFCDDGDKMAFLESELRHLLGNDANVFRSEPFFLEVMPPRLDKAYTLFQLLQHLGLRRADLCACGDGFNDLTMIQYAGLGVAMKNAQPIVRGSADYITENDNDHDGIAEVVERFIL